MAFPPLAVHFAGMAAPAFAGGVLRKNIVLNQAQVLHVQPCDRHGVDGVAVIKKKAGLVGMAEIIEVADLDLAAVEATVEIGDEFLLAVEPDEANTERLRLVL